jgi:dihydrofolate reductase
LDPLSGKSGAPHNPFRDALNNAPKYVASNTLTEPLPWPNSTQLHGEIPAAVAELRKTPGNALHIMGSGTLIQALAPHGLIDEYLLTIHPVVLGTVCASPEQSIDHKRWSRTGKLTEPRYHRIVAAPSHAVCAGAAKPDRPQLCVTSGPGAAGIVAAPARIPAAGGNLPVISGLAVGNLAPSARTRATPSQ